VEQLKLVMFHLIQRHFLDVLRFVAVCNESSYQLSNGTEIGDLERPTWVCNVTNVIKLDRQPMLDSLSYSLLVQQLRFSVNCAIS